jgi:hypothetical protein
VCVSARRQRVHGVSARACARHRTFLSALRKLLTATPLLPPQLPQDGQDAAVPHTVRDRAAAHQPGRRRGQGGVHRHRRAGWCAQLVHACCMWAAPVRPACGCMPAPHCHKHAKHPRHPPRLAPPPPKKKNTTHRGHVSAGAHPHDRGALQPRP